MGVPVTALEGAEAPPAFSATTVTAYAVPLVKPVRVLVVVLELVAKTPLR
jgi:hypothetical protein